MYLRSGIHSQTDEKLFICIYAKMIFHVYLWMHKEGKREREREREREGERVGIKDKSQHNTPKNIFDGARVWV